MYMKEFDPQCCWFVAADIVGVFFSLFIDYLVNINS